jgi:CRISPR-associated protein Cas1
MKKHLNTLYITSEDAYLRKDHETFVVEIEGRNAFQAPIRSIGSIVCFGFKPITPALMAFCTEHNVGISFLSTTGTFLARVTGNTHGNVLLRMAHYAIASDEQRSLELARPIVAAKLANYRSMLLRHMRNHPDAATERVLRPVTDTFAHRIRAIQRACTLDQLRGYEGECAQLYFSVAAHLFTAQEQDFAFAQRTRRPPRDRSNALLSFLYALITNDICSALESVGLDPYVGFFHRVRPGRPSLALDLLEEFRAYLGDRMLYSLVNLRQITAEDFELRPSGEVRICDAARKRVIAAYQQRKQEEITHPFLQEKMTIGLVPFVQAQLLARYIRGDFEEYPPFVVK